MTDENLPIKDILGFPAYTVSISGLVKSKSRTTPHGHRRNGVQLKPSISRGYLRVSLCKAGKMYYRQVHRLVLEAFVGPCPEGMEACHSNGVRSDNRLENLRWGTKKENQGDRKIHGTSNMGKNYNKGELNRNSKLTLCKVSLIRYLGRLNFFTCKDLAWQFNVAPRTINSILNWKTWK